MAATRYWRSFVAVLRVGAAENRRIDRRFLRNRADFAWMKPPGVQRASTKVIVGGFLTAATAVAALANGDSDVLKSRQQQSKPSPSLAEASKPCLTHRERRFVNFASVEYDGQVYMTPQDFLESVTESEPRPRLKRTALTARNVDKLQNATPSVRKTSPTFFRSLREQGMISYTEYLFLLSILTSEYECFRKEPYSGFEIAFNMFDTDGNRRVDRDEFLVLAYMVAQYAWKESGWNDRMAVLAKKSLERIFIRAKMAREKARRQSEKGQTTPGDEAKSSAHHRRYGESDPERNDMEAAVVEDVANVVNTTLMVHFFGKKGQGLLCYDDFRLFMENLQIEVLEIEFHEFSKGLATISELDFAKILHRYTLLHSDDYHEYLSRLNGRIQHTQGITFDEFRAFCQFLNNLEDFSIAMRMYTMADQPISPEEFSRAVKICTGQTLSRHLVETVFQIFDQDNDGHLSYKEFIAIMRDRLHRGIKHHTKKNEGWDAFKACVKEEMRNPL